MTLVLLFKSLLQSLHELFPTAQRLNLFLFFFGEDLFGQLTQPLFGDFRDFFSGGLNALEDLAKNLIEFVQVPLVLHHCSP